MMTTTNLRLPASELAKLEPARPRGVPHVAPVEEAPASRRLRRVVRSVVGFSRA